MMSLVDTQRIQAQILQVAALHRVTPIHLFSELALLAVLFKRNHSQHFRIQLSLVLIALRPQNSCHLQLA